MALERTLSIVKPDGVSRNLIGEVYRRFEKAGLTIIAARMLRLSQREAEGFYAVHRERPFFKDLVRYMTSGPVVVQVLEGENAIARNREIMGATDPKKAAAGHDPRRPCAQHRAERRSRLRRAGHGGHARSPTSSAPRSCIRAAEAAELRHDLSRHDRDESAGAAAPGARGVRGGPRAASRSARAS